MISLNTALELLGSRGKVLVGMYIGYLTDKGGIWGYRRCFVTCLSQITKNEKITHTDGKLKLYITVILIPFILSKQLSSPEH